MTYFNDITDSYTILWSVWRTSGDYSVTCPVYLFRDAIPTVKEEGIEGLTGHSVLLLFMLDPVCDGIDTLFRRHLAWLQAWPAGDWPLLYRMCAIDPSIAWTSSQWRAVKPVTGYCGPMMTIPMKFRPWQWLIVPDYSCYSAIEKAMTVGTGGSGPYSAVLCIDWCHSSLLFWLIPERGNEIWYYCW